LNGNSKGKNQENSMKDLHILITPEIFLDFPIEDSSHSEIEIPKFSLDGMTFHFRETKSPYDSPR